MPYVAESRQTKLKWRNPDNVSLVKFLNNRNSIVVRQMIIIKMKSQASNICVMKSVRVES